MNALKLILAFAFGAYAACTKINLPTDFSTVASGTRANLKANFDEIDSRADACFDSTDEVRGRMSGYTGDFTISSLDHLRLRLDSDGSTTGRFIVMSSNLDSLFRVSEDYNSRLFGHLAIDSNLTVRKVTAADSLLGPSLTLSGLTASRLMATNAGKTAASVSDLTSWVAGTANQITSTSDGDGSLTLSLPSAVTLPGTLTVTGDVTFSNYLITRMPFFGTSGAVTSSSNLTYTTGTSTFATANGTFSGTLGVSGIQTNNAALTFGAAGSSAAYSLFRSATNGMQLRGGTGSSYDLFLSDASGNAVLRVPTGTSTLQLPNSAGVEVTGKLVGSDTIAAALGFRAGSAGATDAQLYRSGANMWTTPDSLTVAGRLAVTGAATAASIALGGNEAFTYDEDTYTGTLTGVTGSVTGTIRYVVVGKQVTIMIPNITGTSNTTSCTITGMPAAIRPARRIGFTAYILDAGAISDHISSGFDIETDGTITLIQSGLAANFTNSGTKGIYGDVRTSGGGVMPFTYTLQ